MHITVPISTMWNFFLFWNHLYTTILPFSSRIQTFDGLSSSSQLPPRKSHKIRETYAALSWPWIHFLLYLVLENGFINFEYSLQAKFENIINIEYLIRKRYIFTFLADWVVRNVVFATRVANVCASVFVNYSRCRVGWLFWI